MTSLNQTDLVQTDGGFILETLAVVAAVGTLIYLAGAAHGHADCEARCSNGGGN